MTLEESPCTRSVLISPRLRRNSSSVARCSCPRKCSCSPHCSSEFLVSTGNHRVRSKKPSRMVSRRDTTRKIASGNEGMTKIRAPIRTFESIFTRTIDRSENSIRESPIGCVRIMIQRKKMFFLYTDMQVHEYSFLLDTLQSSYERKKIVLPMSKLLLLRDESNLMFHLPLIEHLNLYEHPLQTIDETPFFFFLQVVTTPSLYPFFATPTSETAATTCSW